MGILSSRQRAGQPQQDVTTNHAYKFPPRSGNYFGNHFIMGGERFDTPQPEAYLFGENSDLNFLGSRPTPFPYPPPQANEPTKTLKVLVNIRKESLKFVRNTEHLTKSTEHGEEVANKSTQFNIEFTFDCDARCSITIYYFCTEDVTPNGVVYTPRDPTMNSHTFRYKRGANQQFSQSSHIFDPSKYSEEDLTYHFEKDVFPVAIHCVVEEGAEEIKQSHTTIAIVEKHSDGTYVIKALKQKLFVDGLCYLLQELYGIENKNIESNKVTTEEDCEDNGSECVICMCDVRDTLILPCRHLCLCNSCADSLRYQANNCPICRAPFRALLQIRALQKITGQPQALPASPPDGSSENIPAGYEAVSLIEALNGPCQLRVTLPPQTPQAVHQTIANSGVPAVEGDAQIADSLNRCNLERHSSGSIGGNGKIKSLSNCNKNKEIDEKSPRDRSLTQPNTAEYRMSVLLARDEENNKSLPKTSLSNINSLHKSKTELVTPKDQKTLKDYDAEDLEPDDNQEVEGENEGDSDAEKLSPLLTESTNNIIHNQGSNLDEDNGNNQVMRIPLNLEAVLEPIDDTDTDEPEPLSNSSVNVPPSTVEIEANTQAEDSDYFTPEDTQTTILTTPHNAVHKKHESNGAVTAISSTDSTPQRWALPHHITSLPGTPQSHLSNRSSGDSYSSSSSTKQLLTGNINSSGPCNNQNNHNNTQIK